MLRRPLSAPRIYRRDGIRSMGGQACHLSLDQASGFAPSVQGAGRRQLITLQWEPSVRCHVRANETPEAEYCQNCQFRRRDVKRNFQVGTLKGTQEIRNRRGFWWEFISRNANSPNV